MRTNQIQVFFIVIVMIFSTLSVLSQNLEPSYLQSLEDESLLLLYDQHYGDSIVLERIARTYLDRAREEKDTIKMARGYDRLARIFHPEKNIAFADSLIALTKDIEHVTYPAMGYFLKAYEYRTSEDLDNYFVNTKLGYESALKVGNVSHQTFAANSLVFFKSVWGDMEEALVLQRKTHKLIKSEYYKERVNIETRKTRQFDIDSLLSYDLACSYQNFVHCFVNMRKLDSAKYYNMQLRDLVEFNPVAYSRNFLIWSEVSEMEIEYYGKNYRTVINIGDRLLAKEELGKENRKNDVLIFYGLAEFELQARKESGIKKLEEVDSIFVKQNMRDFYPYERLVYEKLYKYHLSINNQEKQLFYLNKLLLVDSILKNRYHYYESKMISEFQTPRLLADKQLIINKLRRENELPDPKFYIILGALTVSLCFLFYYFRKRLVYKRRLEALLAKTKKTENKKLSPNGSYKKEIAKEIAEDILIKLEVFEQKHQFVKSDVNLISLAKKFKTNPNYLSRVINLKLEKNFSQYLHDLRINYALEQVLSNPYYHKYTIKAIAEECGYNSAGSFSRAFYKKTGIYPSYYIEKMSAKHSN